MIPKTRVRGYFPALVAFSVLVFIGSLFAVEAMEYIERLIPFNLLLPAVRQSNMVRYLVGLMAFVVSFFSAYIAVWLLPMKPMTMLTELKLDYNSYLKRMFVVVLVASVALLLRMFWFERNDNAFPVTGQTLHSLPVAAALLLIVCFGVAALVCVHSGRDCPKSLLYCGYVMAVVLSFLSGWLLNWFAADIYHGNAYLDSIYNVYHMVPYTRNTTGIYGHYGLLYAPFMHIFGSSNLVVVSLVASVQAMVTLFVIYSVHHIVRNNWVRIMATFASCMTVFAMRTTNYWQLQPHRVLFPVIVVALVVRTMTKGQWNRKIVCIGYGICFLACLWNSEGGLFCTVALALSVIANNLQKEKWYSPRMIGAYLVHICAIVATVAGAVAAVNIYNYACGYHGGLIIRDYFYPLFESNYMNDTLKIDVQINLDAWVFVLSLFGFVLLLGLYYTTFFHDAASLAQIRNAKYGPVLITVAILGLSNYSYYANRAAYFNLDIIIQLACIGNCVLCEIFARQAGGEKRFSNLQMLKSAIRMICVLVLSVLALQTCLFTAPKLAERWNAGYYSQKAFRYHCEQVQASIPENTFAFGTGISTIYGELNWDTVGHYGDFPDLLIGGTELLEKIAGDAAAEDAFVVFHGSETENLVLERILELEPGFYLAEELNFDGRILQYYIKK